MEVCYLDNQSSKRALDKKFTDICERYKSSIYKLCLVKLNGDSDSAEDCVQNTFMVFYKKLVNQEQINNPRAYLYKIANNHILKCIEERAKHQSRIVPIDDYTDKVIDEQESIDSNLDYDLLNERLSRLLTPNEQQLLKFRYIYDMPIEQVALQLGIKKSAAAKRLQRLREKIKNSINLE